MKAVETTGTIDEQHRLHLNQPLDVAGPSKVRVLILVPEDEELDEQAWLRQAARNPVFGFLKESAEDIYTRDDGKPFPDPR